tara:strand:+ start:177 stop:371 length:195 start_codon:yes stop_codon:yes gene_type:complete
MDINVLEYLKKKINQRRDDIKVAMETGNIPSFDEYKFCVGQIRGLAFVEDEIRRITKNNEADDD